MRNTQKYIIWDNVTPVAITSSTDATPIVVTATTHGFVTGDIVMIYGHTTNVAANGIFRVTRLTANTFSMQDLNSGADVAGSGAGAGSSGVVVKAPKIPYVGDFKMAILEIGTSGTATMTIKVAGTIGTSGTTYPSLPNFGATVTKSNMYTFLQTIDLDTGVAVNGATGIAAAGADIAKQYEININAQQYVTLIPSAWTQGAITAVLYLTDNE